MQQQDFGPKEVVVPASQATATTMMAKALVRDAPPAAMGLMESAHGLG